MTGPSRWQVVTRWLSPNGTDFIHTADFESVDLALKEARVLCETAGELIEGRVLKAVQLVGDFGQLYPRTEPAGAGGQCERRGLG